MPKKSVTAKKAMTNRTKSKFTSHCRISAKTNFLMLLFLARFAHARYSSRMIDRFLNWGNHGKPKSGKIKGRCQPPLIRCLWSLPNKASSANNCNFIIRETLQRSVTKKRKHKGPNIKYSAERRMWFCNARVEWLNWANCLLSWKYSFIQYKATLRMPQCCD